MRLPQYLSPSALEKFYEKPDQTEYYLKYLADNRPPKIPQNDAMSVGSAFDAYVKAELIKDLKIEIDGFDLETLMKTQVEKQNLEFGYKAGASCLEAYKISGAYRRLLHQLSRASEQPRFEFNSIGVINGVPVRGKPDLAYKNKVGAHVIVDWKVNGYCSRSGASPSKGYVLCVDGWHGEHSRTHNKQHKDANLLHVGDMYINAGCFFEDVDIRWARQLVTYGILGGEEIGSNFIIQIEQLACNMVKGQIRCATHAGRASAAFQHKLADQYVVAWKAIQEGHPFIGMTREENDKRCETLNHYHKAFIIEKEDDVWFNEMRGQ